MQVLTERSNALPVRSRDTAPQTPRVCFFFWNSMSADNLDLSRVQRPAWDTERRYGETRNPNSPRFSLLFNRTVFTPQKDPL